MEDYAANLSMMKQCRLYIDRNLDRSELLEGPALAAHYGYSYTNFRRIFLRISGYTVYEYVRMRRVQKAAMCLRRGKSLSAAMDSAGYDTRAGFRRAFADVYGISPSAFSETRGQSMMREPEIAAREDFFVVGYRLPGPEQVDPVETGAFWIAQDFPPVSEKEYGRIGGGAEMVGVWVTDGAGNFYLFGPGVSRVRYVPRNMQAQEVPGGKYAVFRVDKPPDRPLPPPEPGPYGTGSVPDNTMICENFRVTWYYALHQWLPDSDWLFDRDRIAFEYYLDDTYLINVPVKPKIE
ncbi:MAG: AraC family transcriptional regulator [Oscillospiraceae bacterium]|nr:AraC family transcriptional regulator [Oscillospiraceae bacterium]MBR4692974.1 AraC family transcriptional regulator [Oscillospiraceae bacterium]